MRSIVKVLGLVIGMSAIAPAFAESAPVYDADSMQQQFDSTQAASEENLPAPPPPGQEGVFVPAGTSNNAEVQPVVPVQAEAVSAPTVSAPMSNAQRLKKVEQQVNVLQVGSASSRIEALQSEVQSLRGQVEQLTRQLQQLQAAQKTMYTDLDKRVSEKGSTPIEANASDSVTVGKASKSTKKPVDVIAAEKTETPVVVDTGPATPKPDQPNVAEEQQIYQTAYDLIKAKKYNEAVDALQGMLKKYPSGQFAANAHYWLGELYGLMGKSEPALKEFNTVVKTYPKSPRISDAQLKVGLIYASQSKWSDAKDAFKKVIDHYPGTASSRLAAEQLKQIKSAGN